MGALYKTNVFLLSIEICVAPFLQPLKNTKVTITNNGIRIRPEYTIYPANDGILIPCCSAMLFTMKLGPFPMYVFAPINTDPHETAASKVCPAAEPNIVPRF